MRLCHVTLPVAEIARSRAFYLAFGLELIVDSPHYCRFLAQFGAPSDATLSIEQVEGPVAGGAEIGFEFPTAEALSEHVATLRGRGFVVGDPVDQSWLWREARLRDPDGHRLLLLHTGENRLDPPWRLKPGLRFSEEKR